MTRQRQGQSRHDRMICTTGRGRGARVGEGGGSLVVPPMGSERPGGVHDESEMLCGWTRSSVQVTGSARQIF
jgi:hypothetical protein